MTENKTGKYLRYAIGEIALVVIGILIALQINNWNETRKNNQIINTYYTQIVEELKKDTINIQERLVQLDSNISSYNNYLQEFQTLKSLESLLSSQGQLQWTPRILKFNTNTIKTLQTTGDIKLVPMAIRNKLIDLENNQQDWIDVVIENNSLVSEGIMKVINLGLSNNILSSANNQSSPMFAKLQVVNNFPEIALILNGTLGLKNSTENELKEGLKSMKVEMDYIIELINNEKKK